MNREPDIVSRGEKDETECLSLSTPYGSPLTPRTIAQDNGIGLAETCKEKGRADTRRAINGCS